MRFSTRIIRCTAGKGNHNPCPLPRVFLSIPDTFLPKGLHPLYLPILRPLVRLEYRTRCWEPESSMSSSLNTPADRAKVLPAGPDAAARAAAALLAAQLVIVPTETVYGLAFALNAPDARTRIRAVKNIAPKPGWVIHTASVEHALSWAPNLSPLGKRLLTKGLPGPIAFQIKLSDADLAAAQSRLGSTWDETIMEGALTLRVPDSPILRDILSRAADQPVAIIGAGNGAAAYEISDVPDTALAAAEIAVDDGPARYRKASTLVRIDGERYSVVRPGVIDERIINRLADFTILFVCSGNTCRSPMAAALATRQLADRLKMDPRDLHARHIVVQSAGLHAAAGMRATREAVHAVQPLHAELSGHLSQPATVDLLRRADVIYTMTEAHREEILDLMPGAAAKTFRLDPLQDVEDPIGMSAAVYRQVAERLAELIRTRLDELAL